MTDASANQLSGFEVIKSLKVIKTPKIFGGISRHRARRLAAVQRSISMVALPGDCAEFGVYRGECAYLLQAFMFGGRKLHLFDSFEGLPEDWTGKWTKGHFDVKGDIPQFDPKVTEVYKGWFKDTVPAFAASLKAPLSYIHMDGDLYSSAMDVLIPLNEKIVAGTIILFDEYVFKDSEDEHRALMDWSKTYNRTFEYLWRSRSVQVAVRMTN
jgi:hypothetical protein